jgi:hypothetical protein
MQTIISGIDEELENLYLEKILNIADLNEKGI